MSSRIPNLSDLIESPERVAELPVNSVLPLIYQLAALQSALTARLLNETPETNGNTDGPKEDRLLNPDQASALLGVTVKWLYRHANQLPFTMRLSRKALRFSETGLQHWLQKKIA